MKNNESNEELLKGLKGSIGSEEWYKAHKKSFKLKTASPRVKNIIGEINDKEENLRLNKLPKTQKNGRKYKGQTVRFWEEVRFCKTCNKGFIVHKNSKKVVNCRECRKKDLKTRMEIKSLRDIEEKKPRIPQKTSNFLKILDECIAKDDKFINFEGY